MVITCSPRAARGIYDDRAGSMLVAALRAWGFAVPESTVVEDGDPLGVALREALARRPDLILTSVERGSRRRTSLRSRLRHCWIGQSRALQTASGKWVWSKGWAPLFCHEDLPVLPATAS